MEFPAMKRILLLFITILIAVGVVFAVFGTSSSPTAEERKQMDILTGQLFVFNGVTNEIKRARTIAAFDAQHEVIPCLRTVAGLLDTNNWPKNRPLRITDRGDKIHVVWPLPPEIENQPIRWGADYVYATFIDKQR